MENENQTVNQTTETLNSEVLTQVNPENIGAPEVVVPPIAPAPQVVASSPTEEQVMPEITVPLGEGPVNEPVPTPNVVSEPVSNEALPNIEMPTVDAPANQVINETPAPEVMNAQVQEPSPAAPTLAVDPDLYQANVAPVMPSEPVLAPTQTTVGETLDSLQPEKPTLDSSLQNTEAPTETLEQPPIKAKKKGKKGLIIVLLLLIVLIAGGIFAYFKFFNLSSNQVYSKLIDKYSATTEKFMNQKNLANGFTETGNLKITSNLNELVDFNNFSLDYSLGLDSNSNRLKASVNVNQNNNNLIDAALYIVENKLYLDSDNIYDELLLISDLKDTFNFDEFTKNFKSGDTEYLIKGFNNALATALQKASYESKKSEITIDGKKTKVTDNIMIINENNISNIMIALVNEIKNDSKMLEVLASSSALTQDEIKSSLDELLKNQSTSIAKFELKVDVYTKAISNKVVGLDLSVDGSKILTMTSSENKNQQIYKITLLSNNNELGTGTITKTNDGNITFTTAIDGMDLTVNIKNKVESSSSSLAIEASFKKGDEYLTINYEGSTTYNQTLADIDVSKAIDINNLSDDEYQIINDNLNDIFNDIGLYDVMYNIQNNDYLDYDIDYEEDSNNVDTTDDVPAECRYATCDECTGNTCTCTYTDTSFRQNTITCPKEFY